MPETEKIDGLLPEIKKEFHDEKTGYTIVVERENTTVGSTSGRGKTYSIPSPILLLCIKAPEGREKEMLDALGPDSDYDARFLAKPVEERVVLLSSARPSVPEMMGMNFGQAYPLLKERLKISDSVIQQVKDYAASNEHLVDFQHSPRFTEAEAKQKGWINSK